MTLAEIIGEVYLLTGRPDKVSETLSAVKSATLRAHHSDFYYKDLLEAGVQFPTAEYLQTWDYRSTVPNFRSAKYFRKYTGAVAGQKLEMILPEQALDKYGNERQDIWYAAGAFIQLKSSTAEDMYLFGAYVNPDVTQANYQSWIATDHPYAIVYEAAAVIFKTVGKDEEAAQYRVMVAERIRDIQVSNIVSEGY